MGSFLVLVRKELAEDLFAARSLVSLLFASILLTAFSIYLISDAELSLLDNAHAVYMMGVLVTVVGGLLAVLRGSDGLAGERDRETLEALLLAPASGRRIASAKLAGIVFAWLVLFVLALPYLWAVGGAGQNLWPAVLSLLVTGTLVVLVFGAVSLALSARMRTMPAALTVGVVIFLLAASPTLLDASLRKHGIAHILDAANPLTSALNTLDSVLIDSEGARAQWVRLAVMAAYATGAFGLLRLASRRVEL